MPDKINFTKLVPGNLAKSIFSQTDAFSAADQIEKKEDILVQAFADNNLHVSVQIGAPDIMAVRNEQGVITIAEKPIRESAQDILNILTDNDALIEQMFNSNYRLFTTRKEGGPVNRSGHTTTCALLLCGVR